MDWMRRRDKAMRVDTVPLIAVRVVTRGGLDFYELGYVAGKREWWSEWFGVGRRDLGKLKWLLR
jgi:hypothetical protein